MSIINIINKNVDTIKLGNRYQDICRDTAVITLDYNMCMFTNTRCNCYSYH